MPLALLCFFLISSYLCPGYTRPIPVRSKKEDRVLRVLSVLAPAGMQRQTGTVKVPAPDHATRTTTSPLFGTVNRGPWPNSYHSATVDRGQILPPQRWHSSFGDPAVIARSHASFTGCTSAVEGRQECCAIEFAAVLH